LVKNRQKQLIKAGFWRQSFIEAWNLTVTWRFLQGEFFLGAVCLNSFCSSQGSKMNM